MTRRYGCMTTAVAVAIMSALPRQATAQCGGAGLDDLDSRRVHGPLGAKLESMMRRHASDGFSGVVLVVSKGTVLLHQAYGYADRERRIPNTPLTLFEIGSISKTMTAAAILRLQEQGRIALTDPVARYLPGAPPAKAGATIHHLATHTAGLVPRGASLVYDRGRDAFVRSVWSSPQESPPGQQYRYTNAGYSMLAAVVEAAAAEPFERFLMREVLAEAGLKHVRFSSEPATGEVSLALGYQAGNGRPVEARTLRDGWARLGPTGIVTNVGDLYRWHLALRSGNVLNPASKAVMFYPWPTEGYGWHVVGDSEFGPQIHKGGGLPGFAAQILYFPDPDLFIGWVANDLRRPWRRKLNSELPRVVL